MSSPFRGEQRHGITYDPPYMNLFYVSACARGWAPEKIQGGITHAYSK
jgi:hypothetical protein